MDGESAPRNALILRKRSGVYAIIPSTYKAHAEAKFMLRLYTEKIAESG